MGLKKPNKQDRDLASISRWELITGGVQEGGGLHNWGDECSVNREDGEKLSF